MATLEKIKLKNGDSWQSMLDLTYPVGSIYIAYTNTSPATRFGGTWSSISSAFLYGIATSASVGTGGSNSAALVKHTHTFSGKNTTLNPTASYTPAGSVNFSHMHIYNSAHELPVLLKGTGKQILANSTSGASTRLWGVDNSKTYSFSFSVAHTRVARLAMVRTYLQQLLVGPLLVQQQLLTVPLITLLKVQTLKRAL